MRETILRSWRRSVSAGVKPDQPIELPYAGVVDQDSALLRAIRPVAEAVFGEMPSANVAMLATDDEGKVLGRWGNDGELMRILDGVSGTPGYIYREDHAGTSALGTVLEEQHPVAVNGAEHFIDQHQELSAFGAPIIHPASGRMAGVVDFVSPLEQASELMMPLVIRAAGEIGARLLSGYAGADRALLDAYLRSDRRGFRRPVLALNERVMIANPLATDLLPGIPREVLSEKIERALADGQGEVILREGEEQLYGVVREVRTPDGTAGAVVQLRTDEGPQSLHQASPGSRLGALLVDATPGSSAVWRRLRGDCVVAAEARTPALLTGECGVGKRTFALQLSAAADQGRSAVEFDARDTLGRPAADWLAELAIRAQDSSGALLIANLEQLDERTTEALCRWMDERPASGPWLLGTFRTSEERSSPSPALLGRFRHLLEVPPLRDRSEDIPELISAIAVSSEDGRPVRIDPAVITRLTAFEWPGNVRQLSQAVRAAQAASRGSRIRIDDLPSQFSVPAEARPLARLERVERAAIATALEAAGGNKQAAAANLGISRSTLYRKLKVLGLEG